MQGIRVDLPRNPDSAGLQTHKGVAIKIYDFLILSFQGYNYTVH